MINENPEQIARDHIDRQLLAAGWIIQPKTKNNLNAGIGVAVREYSTSVGPADYVLFVDKKAVGIIEAKREEEGDRLSVHEDQTEYYAYAKLKYLDNQPLVFLYESTGEVTSITDYRDPKPRARPVFTFHCPETFREWLKQPKSLRAGLLKLYYSSLPGRLGGVLRDCQRKAINSLEKSSQRKNCTNYPRNLRAENNH